MYALQYGNTDMARATLASIPAGKGLDACASCEACSVGCRNSVNVAQKISDPKALR
jgi:succinate dehydrogenase/fumarate reductase-like Fe-S protein